MRTVLDHSIVGQSLTSLTINKDRLFAGCRVCGAVFQARLAIELSDEEWNRDALLFEHAVAIETKEWRERHRKSHTEREHEAFRASGRTFSPGAAHRLAPFGLISWDDAQEDEVAHAMLVAPRAPIDDVETTLKGWV
jgi:hypothetical protein